MCFVNDLEAFCKAEAKGVLSNIELYLLRNHNSDKAISFFAESGFRPDFILWLLHEDRQTIAFLDPKGSAVILPTHLIIPKSNLLAKLKPFKRI